MRPPPHELRGREDARQGRQAPSVINPPDMAYEDARIETIRAYQAKTIDEAERAKLRQQLIAEMEQRERRERREYEGKKRRRQKPKSVQALREYHRNANRKYQKSLQESEQRINAILAKRRTETKTEAEQRRRQAFTAENAHQHHLADQAGQYLNHLVEDLFPFTIPSELDYLCVREGFEHRYLIGEFAPKELE